MRKWPGRLAWAIAGLVTVEIAVFGVLAARRWTLFPLGHAISIQLALLGSVYPAVGAVIASRRPRNPIGWIFLVIGSSAAGGALATALTTDVPLGRPDTPWGAMWGAWLNQWVWGPAYLFIPTFVFLLFPDGHLPSRRFRPVAWLAGLGVACLVVGGWLSPTAGGPGFRNPVVTMPASVDLLIVVGVIAGLLLAGLGSIAAVVYRFVRSGGVERQQLKWFAYAAIATAVLFFGLTIEAKGPVRAIGFLAIPLLPVATAIAILRYRLYDIDRIISRTVSYALVTGLLAGTFALVVLVPTTVFGTGRRPGWLIAAATLAVAALFRPVRQRVQTAIDLRFNRRRYDAEHTIETFTARLREQIDIDALGAELCAVVNTTMQPSGVSLWLVGTS
jgi:hypothetical protein